MIGDHEDAEEALQDSFVRATGSLARCDDPARFGAWLYGILVNRCRTTGARAARRRRTFVNDAPGLERSRARRPGRPAGLDRRGRQGAGAPGTRSTAKRFFSARRRISSMTRSPRLTGAGVSALKMRVKRAASSCRSISESGAMFEPEDETVERVIQHLRRPVAIDVGSTRV